jgi:hypothetical protein
VGGAGRLGQAEARCEAQGQATRGGEAHAVAHGHVDRRDEGLRAHDLADHLTAVAQRRVRAAARPGLAVLAHETALGDADRGQVERHPEMAGQAEAARVGAAVRVADHEVRPGAQLREGLEQRRQLAEREVARHIGEARATRRGRHLDPLEARGVEHDHRREQHGATAVVGDVGTGHEAETRGQLVALAHRVAQALLEGARLRDAEAL